MESCMSIQERHPSGKAQEQQQQAPIQACLVSFATPAEPHGESFMDKQH